MHRKESALVLHIQIFRLVTVPFFFSKYPPALLLLSTLTIFSYHYNETDIIVIRFMFFCRISCKNTHNYIYYTLRKTLLQGKRDIMIKHKDHFHGSDLKPSKNIIISKRRISSASVRMSIRWEFLTSCVPRWQTIWMRSQPIRTGNTRLFAPASQRMRAHSRKM